jgi:predicted P-loop ATPase
MPHFSPQDIFPLNQTSLTPRVKWGTPGDYTIPEGEVYGVPTGPRNGVWVLDLDQKNGKDGLASLRAYVATIPGASLSNTYTVATKSGGYHLYFNWSDDRPVKNSVGVLEGVDVRGRGGFVRAGGAYRVAVDVPPIDAPEWLLDLVTSGQDAEAPAPGTNPAHAMDPTDPRWQARVEMAQRFLAEEPACISGQGGQAQIWKIARRLTRTYELPVDACLALLADYNARCVPPWTKPELERTLARAAALGQGPTGTWTPADVDKLFSAPTAPAGPAPVTMLVPADGGPVSDWRQRPDPNHVYSFFCAVDVHGPEPTSAAATLRKLTSIFAGPAATPEWRGVFQFDAFKHRIVAVNPPLRLEGETAGGITNADITAVRIWLQSKGVLASAVEVNDAIHAAARVATYHPIREYLESLPEHPVEQSLAYFHGIASRLWGAPAERDELESGYLRRHVMAAVRRIRRPGTKYDIMIILAGAQGYNKSRFVRYLFGDDYTQDNLRDLSSKEACIDLDGFWGVEMAEMASFNRAEQTVRKRFLSLQEDKYRPPYERATIANPRQCVFIGTTNDDEILDDPTGDRRYGIIEIVQPIDLTFDRDEFWSHAATLEKHLGPGAIWPDAEESSKTRKNSARFTAEDPWVAPVRAFLAACKTKGATHITATDVLTLGLALAVDKQDSRADNRVKKILRKICGNSVTRRFPGKDPMRAYLIP